MPFDDDYIDPAQTCIVCGGHLPNHRLFVGKACPRARVEVISEAHPSPLFKRAIEAQIDVAELERWYKLEAE